MSNIIPFETNAKVPAYLRTAVPAGNVANFGSGGGFNTISIKGKVFHQVRGGEKTLIVKPGTDEPVSGLEVVILGVGPEGNNFSKVWYAKSYSEGDDAKPDCYSNDGIAPAADAVNPQAKKCALCPHNQFGSRITEAGKKAKECQDTKRLAVAAPDQVNEPFLLRVPAGSLKALREYGQFIAKRGVQESFAVVTRIGFDYTVAHPALTFKPMGWVSEDTYREAVEAAGGDLVQQIIGAKEMGIVAGDPDDAEPFDTLGEAPAHVAETKKPASRSKKAAADDLPTEPKKTVKVEGEDAETKKPAPTVVDVDADADYAGALDDLDFDD